MIKIRPYTGLALLVLIAIFIAHNASVVDIKLLFWTLSRSLMIFFVLTTGIVIGWLSCGLFRKKRTKDIAEL